MVRRCLKEWYELINTVSLKLWTSYGRVINSIYIYKHSTYTQLVKKKKNGSSTLIQDQAIFKITSYKRYLKGVAQRMIQTLNSQLNEMCHGI
jgi:hypothetical protein